jgi:prevent-host-death family protein
MSPILLGISNDSHPPVRWLLQDAKARFSELVRRVRSEGPQHVTVRGRDEVVVIAAEEFRRLKGDLTGEALIAAMQASPHRDIEIEPRRAPMPVRKVALRRVSSSTRTAPMCL